MVGDRLMPEYQYRCDSCGSTVALLSRDNIPPCPTCGLSTKRQWGFNHVRGIQPHYNRSINQWVENKNEFYDGLKRQSEEHSIRTGIEHDYQPIDPTDMKDPAAHGVTEEGLEVSRRTLHDEGLLQ